MVEAETRTELKKITFPFKVFYVLDSEGSICVIAENNNLIMIRVDKV